MSVSTITHRRWRGPSHSTRNIRGAWASSRTSRLQDQGGSALIAVLLLAAAMLTLGAFAARSAQVETRIAYNHTLAQKALDTAEAGLNHGFNLLQTAAAGRLVGQTFTPELNSSGTGSALATLGDIATLNGATYRSAAFGSQPAGAYYVRVVDNSDEQSGSNDVTTDTDYRVYVVSQGMVNGAERTIRALVTGTPLFAPGQVFGKRFVTLSGGAIVDSFDSRQGSYNAATAGTNDTVGSNGNITLSGGGTILNGKAVAAGTVSASGGSVVSPGPPVSNAPTVTWPSVAPCGPPYSSGAGFIGGSYNASTGVLTVSGGTNVTFNSGTYCLSSVTLSGGSTLTVSGWVTIYLTATSTFSGGSIVNNTQRATNLRVYSSSPSGSKLTVSGGGAVTAMIIYAPNADITFSGGGNFYGAAVGNSITNSGGSDIHVDTALDVLGPWGIRLANWQEVRNN